jgi:hypothetical protein
MLQLKEIYSAYLPDDKAKLLAAFQTLEVTGMLERMQRAAAESLVSQARGTPLDQLSNLSQAVTGLNSIEAFTREIREILTESGR